MVRHCAASSSSGLQQHVYPRFCVASVRCLSVRVCAQPALLRGTAVPNLHYSGICLSSAGPALLRVLSMSRYFACIITGTCTIQPALVVLTLTRIIKSVVTGQAPFTLELRNTPGKTHTQPKVVHAFITPDAIHASTRNIKVKSGVSLRCARL